MFSFIKSGMIASKAYLSPLFWVKQRVF